MRKLIPTVMAVMGAGTDDEHVSTSVTATSISWVGNFQYVDHPAREPVWVHDIAGGGFAASTSPAVPVTAG